MDDEFGFVQREESLLERVRKVSGNKEVGSEVPRTQEEHTSAQGEQQVPPRDERKKATTQSPNVEKFGQVYDPTKKKEQSEDTVDSSKHRPSKLPGQGLLKKMSVVGATTIKVEDELPQSFQVKYLGSRDAGGLWGLKHTRRPVDSMVSAAKNLKAGIVLPMVKLVVDTDGVTILPAIHKRGDEIIRQHPIDTISYGVQDLVYTRVFSMIVVRESVKDVHPFECHAFVCDSRNGARRLTYALAAAFNEYSKKVKKNGDTDVVQKKKFAIDLRSPEEIEADFKAARVPDDSEA